ncbi:unnamed protein product [Gongylonema pulchrum]|uniref:Uncharacterized protein n=1 Tax=Gongylonema pulchrum TaxID=637853 RepID=A0A183ESP2_9BILA|nr:unnamed protein product [Gongylonema pulchrum]
MADHREKPRETFRSEVNESIEAQKDNVKITKSTGKTSARTDTDAESRAISSTSSHSVASKGKFTVGPYGDAPSAVAAQSPGLPKNVKNEPTEIWADNHEKASGDNATAAVAAANSSSDNKPSSSSSQSSGSVSSLSPKETQ